MAWLSTHIVPLRDRASRIVSYLGVNVDIAGFKRTEETLRASETRFRGYFELSLVGVALTGPDKRWWEVNDRLCEILGYRREQLLRLSWAEQTHPDDLDVDIAQFERVMARRIDGYSLDKRFLRPDGVLVYASVSTRCVRRSNGMVDHFVTVVQDITERKQAEERIQKLAHHDALTGLPNRELLIDRLLQAVTRADRDHTQVGVLLVDLDLFKRINDTLGHSVGDQLLRNVAARLQGCARPGDTVSRQGGDEFAVVLPDLANANDDAARIAQRILNAVARPYALDDKELHASCSIGISVFPRDGRGAENLLKNADVALYRAKDMGRGPAAVGAVLPAKMGFPPSGHYRRRSADSLEPSPIRPTVARSLHSDRRGQRFDSAPWRVGVARSRARDRPTASPRFSGVASGGQSVGPPVPSVRFGRFGA